MAQQKKHWNDLQICELIDLPYLDNSKAWRKVIYKKAAYFVSDDAQVYSASVFRLLNGQIRDVHKRKYKHYNLKGQWFSAHILCMMCHGFKQPTPQHEINHIDMDSLNNHIKNLEWLTHKENIQHAYDNGRKTYKGAEHWKYGTTHTDEVKARMSQAKKGIKHPKFKGYYVVNGVNYTTSTEAAQATGLNSRTIIRRCKEGQHKPYFDFIPL